MEEMISRIKAIKEYLKYFPDDRTANNNLILYEYRLHSKINEILIQDKRKQLKQLQEELEALDNA